jgi:hypothetical protein
MRSNSIGNFSPATGARLGSLAEHVAKGVVQKVAQGVACERSGRLTQGSLSSSVKAAWLTPILKMSELPSPEPSLTTLPASHGKLADSRSRPFVNVLMIAECEDASATKKQKHI